MFKGRDQFSLVPSGVQQTTSGGLDQLGKRAVTGQNHGHAAGHRLHRK
jgi:hypothetical protein